MTGYAQVTYTPVAANAIMPMAEGPSGGGSEVEMTVHVNWDENTGITGGGWYQTYSRSPFYNKTTDEILAEIQDNGNLDDSFGNWTVDSSFINDVWACCSPI